MKHLLITTVFSAALLAQDKPKAAAPDALTTAESASKTSREAVTMATVTHAQWIYEKAKNAMFRAELAKRQFIDAQREYATATAEQQKFTEDYKAAETLALKALGKSPDMYTFNAETGQAQPKETAKK
jgi:hypothetical protein